MSSPGPIPPHRRPESAARAKPAELADNGPDESIPLSNRVPCGTQPPLVNPTSEAMREHLQPIQAATNRLASDSLCLGDPRSREGERVECDHGRRASHPGRPGWTRRRDWHRWLTRF